METIPNGVYPTMITPYTDDNKIDFNGVFRILEWYDNKGVTEIFAVCQSSEIFFLSFEERLSLLKFIMRNKPAGMTVVASGHTSTDTDVMRKEAEAFIETGINGYVFSANRLVEQNDPDELLAQRLLDAADALPCVPLGIYECPYPYKRLITPFVLSRITENERFQFLKDTCCDLTLIKEKLNAAQSTNMKIFNANSATLLASLRMGCAGFSGVMANFHPELYLRLLQIYRTDPELAERIQNLIGTLSMSECQCYPVNAKYYLTLEGLPLNIYSRSRNESEFGPSRKEEIRQMRDLTLAFEKTL
jgi:4-hydroxy-tetrahydrodipicolinate synthase